MSRSYVPEQHTTAAPSGPSGLMPWQLIAACTLMWAMGIAPLVHWVSLLPYLFVVNVDGTGIEQFFGSQRVLLQMLAPVLSICLLPFVRRRHPVVLVGLILTAGLFLLQPGVMIWQVWKLEASFPVGPDIGQAFIVLMPLIVLGIAGIWLLTQRPVRSYFRSNPREDRTRPSQPGHAERPSTVLGAQGLLWSIAVLSAITAVLAFPGRTALAGTMMFIPSGEFAMLYGQVPAEILVATSATIVASLIAARQLGRRKRWIRISLATVAAKALIEAPVVLLGMNAATLTQFLIASAIAIALLVLLLKPSTRAWCDR